MRRIKVLLAVLLVIIISLQLFGCKVSLPEPADISSSDEAISMDFYAQEYKSNLKVGEYTWMNVNIKIDYEYAIAWSSSNPEVATVDSGGRVDAISPGKATITARVKKASVDFNLTVSGKKTEALSMSTAVLANESALQENLVSGKDINLYRIMINTSSNCATVYTYNANGTYKIPVRSMVCSTGKDFATPDGSYTISSKDRWEKESDGKYYQYHCNLSGESEGFAISSAAYESQSASKLLVAEYNKLGTSGTNGNVRFGAEDAKWIYENCTEGTLVKVVSTGKDELDRPTPMKIADTAKTGWDPTDAHEDNPYNKKVPVFAGVDDTYVCENGVFDRYDGVVAYDTGGNEAEGKVTAEGKVICTKVGSYVVTYEYTDSMGRTGRHDRVVTVLSKDEYNAMTADN